MKSVKEEAIVAHLINIGGFLNDDYVCSNCKKVIWEELAIRAKVKSPSTCKHCGAVIIEEGGAE